MFKTARAFGDCYEDWNVDSLRARSDLLAEWAIERWPNPSTYKPTLLPREIANPLHAGQLNRG